MTGQGDIFSEAGKHSPLFCVGSPICVIVLLLLFSCATAPVQLDSNAVIIEGAPFYPQEDYQCGPASLASVMNYLGAKVSPEDIAKDIYSESARGTLNIDMLLYVQKKNLRAEQYIGSWDDLKAKINRGSPLVVLVDYGFSLYQVNHFMTVIGYNENGVFANSGKTELKFIDKDSFMKSWERTNFWTLWIKQKSEARSQKSEK